MKFFNVKSSTYFVFKVKWNDKGLKFKVWEYGKLLKYEIIFTKVYTGNWFDKVLWLKS